MKNNNTITIDISLYIYILVGGFNPSEKNSQLELVFPIYGKNVPNHQSVYVYNNTSKLSTTSPGALPGYGPVGRPSQERPRRRR